MPDRPAWNKRAPEETRLFNPAFIGSLAYEFVKVYGSKQSGSAPMTLLVVALTISLHGSSRKRLPYSIVTSLYEWLQINEDLLIKFPERARGLLPYIQDAMIFAMIHKNIGVKEGHHLHVGPMKSNFSPKFLEETTPETRDIIDRTKFLGRWFAKSGSEPSILAAWGVRP